MDSNDIQKMVDEAVKKAMDNQDLSYEVIPNIPVHYHNNIDSPHIDYDDLDNRRVFISHTVYGSSAATAANYGTILIAPRPMYLNAVYEVHETAGSDGGAVTLQIEKLTGTTAKDSGTVMLTTAFNLKGTANTVQTGDLVKTSYPTIQTNTLYLGVGDRIALKDSGTLTSLSNVTVTLLFQLL